MPTTKKHRRHRKKRTETRVKRGGMKLEPTSRAAMKNKKQMYAILFSPHVQSSMPLGLQLQEILQSPDCQMDVTEMKTMCQFAAEFAYDEYRELGDSLFESPVTIFVQGCQAEMNLKTSIKEIFEQVNAIQTAEVEESMWSPFFSGPPPVHHMPPRELMENFECVAPDFARKIMNLHHAFYNTRDGPRRAHVYHHGNPERGILSTMYELAHSAILPQIKSIQKSFQTKLKLLEMVRDVALPEMIRHPYYVPDFLLSDDPAEFKRNIDAFKMNLDATIRQQKHILGDDVLPTQMLHEISHLSVPHSDLQRLPTRSLQLAPPPAAITALIPELSVYDPSQETRKSLLTKGALTKILAGRLTGDKHQTTPFKNAQHAQSVIGRHNEFNPHNDDDRVPYTGPMVAVD